MIHVTLWQADDDRVDAIVFAAASEVEMQRKVISYIEGCAHDAGQSSATELYDYWKKPGRPTYERLLAWFQELWTGRFITSRH